MKKIVFLTLLIAGFSANAAFAHCGTCGIGGEKGSMHDKMHDKNQKMAEQLGLSEEQAKQVDTLMQEKMKKKKAFRSESKEKIDAIKEEYDAKLKKILTPEQYKKHQTMYENMKESHKGSHKGSDKDAYKSTKGSHGDMKGSHGSMKDK